MAHNSSYTKVWDPYGTSEGLDVFEVMTCLGTDNQDVGAVCTSANINKWAKYKPVILNTFTPVTRAQRVTQSSQDDTNVNWGFIKDLFSSTYLTVFTRAIRNNADWEYNRPTASTGKFRLLDFSDVNSGSAENGYDHTATAPIELWTDMPNKPASNGAYTCSLKASGDEGLTIAQAESSQDLRFDNFEQVKTIVNGGGTWKCCLMFRKVGNASPSYEFDDAIFTNGILDTADPHYITHRFTTYGDYDVVLGLMALEDEDDDTSNAEFVPVPGAYKRITYAMTVIGIGVYPDNPYWGGDVPYNFTRNASDYLTRIRYAFNASNLEDSTAHTNFQIHLKATNTDVTEDKTAVSTAVAVAVDASIDNIVLDIDLTTSQYVWEDDNTTLECWYTYNTGGVSHTRYYNLETDQWTDTQVAAVAIEDILTAHSE